MTLSKLLLPLCFFSLRQNFDVATPMTTTTMTSTAVGARRSAPTIRTVWRAPRRTSWANSAAVCACRSRWKLAGSITRVCCRLGYIWWSYRTVPQFCCSCGKTTSSRDWLHEFGVYIRIYVHIKLLSKVLHKIYIDLYVDSCRTFYANCTLHFATASICSFNITTAMFIFWSIQVWIR